MIMLLAPDAAMRPEGAKKLKVLLVYPRSPDTFWSFKHVLRFVAKRAAFPPLQADQERARVTRFPLRKLGATRRSYRRLA